jgi:hypothetical protein
MKRRVELSKYFPVHEECGKQQPPLTAEERKELLRRRHVTRFCDVCQKPWIFEPPPEDMAKLRRLGD